MSAFRNGATKPLKQLIRAMCSDSTSGSGKSSGGAGAIRQAGGVFGKMEQAREEEYFRKMQASQLKQLQKDLDREIEHHRKQMANHEEAIFRHKRRMNELAKDEAELMKE